MAKKRTLSYREVAALAESVGLPGKTFAQIAKGESGYQVGAVGHDPGGTQGLGLWQITTKYNDDVIAKYGGRKKLLTDPVANAKAAKAIFDRQGIKAWYGTKYMTSPNAHYNGPKAAPSTYGSAPTTPGPDAKKQLALSLLGFGGAGDYGDPLTSALISANQAKTNVRPVPPKGPQPTGSDITAIVTRAKQIDAERLPYKWGGGHGTTPAGPGVPVDCSGAVSRLLGVSPRVSGQFEKFGKPGAGKALTIYANGHHVLLEIKGHFWGTSAANPGGGAGWIPRSQISPQYLKNFVARHPPNM